MIQTVANGGWVVWDTGVLDRLWGIFTGNVGSAVVTGAIIFAGIFGIYIAIRVVKHFTK